MMIFIFLIKNIEESNTPIKLSYKCLHIDCVKIEEKSKYKRSNS